MKYNFNRRINLAVQNSDGSYEVIMSASAHVRTLSVTQLIQAKATNIEYTNEFYIRYRNIPKEITTVVFNNRYFDIKTIINIDEKNEVLRINCSEVV